MERGRMQRGGGRGMERGRMQRGGGRGMERGRMQRGGGRGRRGGGSCDGRGALPIISRPPAQIPVPEASCRTLQPVKRPDEGATNPWKTVDLQVNHFLVKFSPGTTILQYNVDVKPVRGRRMRIPQYALSTIRNKLCSDPPLGFPMPLTVDVAARQIFSATPLPTADFVMDFSDEEDMQFRSYKVTIKLARELKLSDLDDYISGRLMSIPHDVFNGVNQVMRENPRRHMISRGARFFEREPRVNDDLGRGIMASRRFRATVKATSQGLAMCVDSTILAFQKPMLVIDFLGQLIDGFDIKSFQRFKMKVNATLKGLKVYVTHQASKREYIIRGLTKEKPKDILLTVGDPPRKISILQYFWEKHGKEVVHKDIPCLDLGKRNSVPMEFCELVYGQRYDKAHLNEHVVTALMEVSVAPPKMRRDNICTFVCSGDGPLGGGIARNFGLEVEQRMTEVTGHCIAPPLLKLAAENGRMIPVTVDEEKCNWNLIGKSVVEGKRIDRWGVIDFSSELDLEEFVLRLTNMCKSLGIHMEEPLRRHSTMSTLSSVPNLRALLESLNKEAFDSKKLGSNLQFILCVMSKKDRGYKQLKWISETQVGIVTQCCLSTRANEANASFLTNLAFKINAKLGGSNVELHDPFLEFEGKGCVLFLGADVNHPTDDTSPSIAAVVATTNWPAANRYAARVRMQEHRTERILHFGDMSLELLQHYAQLNNVWPDKIVVFRDGVGDSNFYMVLNEELSDLRRAFKTVNYNPAITLIVVHKRHSTRFFLEHGFGNVSPGTVVDKKIVHPFEFDFYLCSHYGCFGTSKAPHYHVLLNENEFSSDLLQRVIYYLCFTYACGTRPVSLVPPVYYADHVAYRGRLYYEAMEEGQSPASKAPSSSSSHSSYQNFFKLHADLENEMFFV